MQFHFHANQSHFHTNGFVLRLALKLRRKGTRKWPIDCSLQNRRIRAGPAQYTSAAWRFARALVYRAGPANPPVLQAKLTVHLKAVLMGM